MGEAPNGSDGYRANKQPRPYDGIREGDPLDSLSDQRDFAALVCGITMSGTGFGITYGRSFGITYGRND
jgi:hypothetical protein